MYIYLHVGGRYAHAAAMCDTYKLWFVNLFSTSCSSLLVRLCHSAGPPGVHSGGSAHPGLRCGEEAGGDL